MILTNDQRSGLERFLRGWVTREYEHTHDTMLIIDPKYGQHETLMRRTVVDLEELGLIEAYEDDDAPTLALRSLRISEDGKLEASTLFT